MISSVKSRYGGTSEDGDGDGDGDMEAKAEVDDSDWTDDDEEEEDEDDVEDEDEDGAIVRKNELRIDDCLWWVGRRGVGFGFMSTESVESCRWKTGRNSANDAHPFMPTP